MAQHYDRDGDGVADPDWLHTDPRRAERKLTGTDIRGALAAVRAVGKQIVGFDDLAAGATDALRQAPVGLTKEGASAFLATCAVESAWFRTTTVSVPWCPTCTHALSNDGFHVRSALPTNSVAASAVCASTSPRPSRAVALSNFFPATPCSGSTCN